MFRSWPDRLLGILFPERCPTCGGLAGAHRIAPFCVDCWLEIRPYTGPMCERCGLPLPSPHSERCSDCLADPPAYRTHRSFGLHGGCLREALHQFKYKRLRRLAGPLAELLAGMNLPSVDWIVPVPLHPLRLREREFNQAALIARHLSRRIGVPVDLFALEKYRNSPPQVGLRRRERLRNERRAFRLRSPSRIRNSRVLLLDDVATTGATLRACSEALEKGGASEIHALTVARSTVDVGKSHVAGV